MYSHVDLSLFSEHALVVFGINPQKFVVSYPIGTSAYFTVCELNAFEAHGCFVPSYITNFNDPIFTNALVPILVIFDGIVIVSNPVPSNDDSPIFVTWLNDTEFNLLHPLNALFDIVVIQFPNETPVISVHPLNACVPIVLISFGIVKSPVNPLHPLNA